MDFLQDDGFEKMICSEIFCITTLMKAGALRNSVLCSSCSEPMRLILNETERVFRCGKKRCCKRRLSHRSGSFFCASNLECREVMRVARDWLTGLKRKAMIQRTKYDAKTVTFWYARFSDLVGEMITLEGGKIGGPGIVVEVDETKLGKRKYHRGHRVEGVWVLNGIERTPERRIFCVPVESRDAATLEMLISEHVEQGSIVHTDGWKGYSRISQNCAVEHLTVNHTRFFKDPETGACTNMVEGLNGGLKSAIPPRCRTQKSVGPKLKEHVWRRVNKDRLSEAFYDALRFFVEKNKEN